MVRRALPLVGLAGAGAAVAAVLVGSSQGWWHRGGGETPPVEPVAFHAVLEPRTIRFGDPLHARLEVVIDPRRADPASVHLTARFAPFRVVSATQTRSRSGRTAVAAYRYTLECLAPACAPGQQQVERRLPQVDVSYRTLSGSQEARVDWPSFLVGSHVTDADRAAPGARLRVEAPLPPVSYRIDPLLLRVLLLTGAGVLGFGAIVLVALALRRPRPAAERAAEPEPLAQALALVEATAANGSTPDQRRRALEELARRLDEHGLRDLAGAAGRLAWSPAQPTPSAARTLAETVERYVEARS
jgi:hypothetical protein